MWVKICGLTNESDARAALAAGADALGLIFARSSPRYVLRHSPNWWEWLLGIALSQSGFYGEWLVGGGADATGRGFVGGGADATGRGFVGGDADATGGGFVGGDADATNGARSVGVPADGVRHPKAELVLVLTAPDELPPDWRLFDAVQWVVPNGLAPSAAALRWLPDLPLWAAFRFPPEISAYDALRTLESWSPYAERFVLDTYHPQQLGGTGAVQDWRRAAAICQRAPKPTILAGGLNAANVADAIRTVQPAGVDVSSGVEAAAGRKDHAQVRAFIQNAKSALEGRLE